MLSAIIGSIIFLAVVYRLIVKPNAMWNCQKIASVLGIVCFSLVFVSLVIG